MRTSYYMQNKTLIIIIAVLVVIVLGVYFILVNSGSVNNNLQGNTVQPSAGPTSFDIQGIKVEIVRQGIGEGAKTGDQITAHYVMTLPDGKELDNSIKRNTPFVFTLGENRVIKGWELGVLGMKVGESRKLTVPPELGYGVKGVPPIIPPNSTLIYVIQRLK